MRVLHIFDHSVPLQSGYVSRSLSIIRAQRARGWETIHLTTPRHVGATASREVVDGLTFFRTPGVPRSMPGLLEVREMLATRRALDRLINAERPDVIHAHSPVLNALPALAAGRKFDIPVVYEVRAFWEDAAVDHGTTRENSLRYNTSRWLETQAMRRADHIVALCEGLRKEIVQRGVSAARVTIVPNAVEASAPPPSNDDGASVRDELGAGDACVLGFIGSFYAYEGLDLLFEALGLLRQLAPPIAVMLVGGGPDESRLRELVAAASLQDIVHFVGRVHHRDVARYYRAIDILVYPRRRRRLTELVTPLKPLEAMAQQRPLVASNVGGHRELVRDGETGYLFEADNAGALAEKLRAVIADPRDRLRVVRNGRSFVEQSRNWATVTHEYARIYEQLLGRRHA